MSLSRIFLLLTLLLIFSPPCLGEPPFDDNSKDEMSDAKSNNKQPAPQTGSRGKRWRWMLSGFLGTSHTHSSDLTIAQPALGTQITFRGVDYSGRPFESPLYYGYRVGAVTPLSPHLGFEAEFIHFKVFSNPSQPVQATGENQGVSVNRSLPLGDIVQQFSISHGVNILTFNAVGRYPLLKDASNSEGRLILTARFGVGPTIPHTESTINNQKQEQYELGRIALQIGGGAELKIWRGIFALGEYKFTRTRQKGKVFSGESETLLLTHHGVFGLSLHF